MDYLVEFLESGGARIIKDPLLISKKQGLPNTMLNPPIDHLKGISPSFWIQDGEVIGAHSPEIMQQMVKDSLSESHPFSKESDLPFSPDSKFIQKITEIDAKQDEQIKYLMEKMLFHHDDMYFKMNELKLDLDMKNKLQEEQIKSIKKIGMIISFSCILTMILLKFL